MRNTMRNTMRKPLITAVGAVGLVVAGLTLTVGPAAAGHENVVLQTALDGRAEVSDGAEDRRLVGDPDGRGQAYVFGIDGDSSTLCYVLTVDRIGTATAAHIHQGAAGTNGPVVANLAAPADGNAADCLTEGEAGKGLAAGRVAEILADPQDYYVNVHNAEHPGGAIRGQLSPQG
jgi:hypothetical protein